MKKQPGEKECILVLCISLPATDAMSRIICAPAPMVATEAKLDGKHTHFAAHPLLHENVAHFNPGSDLYVPARASKASSITPSQPTLKYMRCLNQAFIHP